MRAFLAGTLRTAGYHVVELPDGNALWAALREGMAGLDNPSTPDLVICDLRIPGADGLEVLSQLRAWDWATPVILMTALRTPEALVEAKRLGATAVLTKPFDVDELVAVATRLVDPLA